MAAKPEYRLQTLLGLRERKKEEAEQYLARTMRALKVEQDRLREMEEELERMRQLVHTAMREGAMGIGSSLIYAPAFYAKTDELVELCKVAAEYGGSYISHMRSEGNRLLESVEELLTIAREAGIEERDWGFLVAAYLRLAFDTQPDVADVARMLRSHRVHHVLVAEGEELRGIASAFDLIALIEN